MDFDTIDSIDFEDLELLGRVRRPNRLRTIINPFTELDEEDFKSKYRFTKIFGNKIVDLVKDKLRKDPRGSPICPEVQVACALRSWARHEIQDDTADLHGVSQPTVSKVCRNVAEALASLSSRYIKMPASITEVEQNMINFRRIANFPSVIGAIDCTHIRVKKVSSETGQLYINRKGFSSINVQVVCNANLKIIDIIARWRGSAHDSRIFRESRLKQRFEAGAFRGILLGDNGYPCTHYLLTPVRNPHSPQEHRYNSAHIKTRNTVERCFGMWKQRFRCLLRGMYGSIETCKKTIVACAVLHNIAIDMQENIFPDGEILSAPNDSRPAQLSLRVPSMDTQSGSARRRQFIESNF